MDNKFSSLPDYPALKKLSSALWEQDSTYHGAAVMVGAGFSRATASMGDAKKKLPLWGDFLSVLGKDLSSDSTPSQLPNDPLRLAEEYCAYFGRQELQDLIKREINDTAWNPGELHRSLLSLPWTEVLTTNWDTLIERASQEVHDPVYSIVTRQQDLSNARSPRIVKLHGTIEVTDTLVFTQEDYRKYPQQYAAFVNFARQVFIENELCLLGFSGDDPNFLQWAGWVRDNLADRSRRIYLVGPLGLNAAKRKYLESINVSPIDLLELVSEYDDPDTKHLEATRLFIQYLRESKPVPAWEWKPENQKRNTLTSEERSRIYNDPVFSAKLLEEQLPILAFDRNSYPGWIIPPVNVGWRLYNQINTPSVTEKNLSSMHHDKRAQLLYEITWLYEKTYEPLPSWLVPKLLDVCDLSKPCVLSKRQQLEIALFLLKSTRWMGADEANSITLVTSSILENGVKYWPDCQIELAYHRAIVARDLFDYPALVKYVDMMSSLDPMWKLKKASLLADLGEFKKGEALVAEAYRELLMQHRKDRNSLYILSRLAWAHWFSRGIETSPKLFPSHYKEPRCNPWDHLETLSEKITSTLSNQIVSKEVVPLFEPGHYKDNSEKLVLSNSVPPLYLLEGITVTTGLPLRWIHTNFLATQAEKIVDIEYIPHAHCFKLAMRIAQNNSTSIINKVFSRVNIAYTPKEDIETLLTQCNNGIEYWGGMLEKNVSVPQQFIIGRLNTFIEIMSRLMVRATSEEAKRRLKFVLSLCKESKFQRWQFFDSLKKLANTTIESIPQTEHHEILLDALLFPLKCEINSTNRGEPREPGNPIIYHPGQRRPNIELDRRILEIIDSMVYDSEKNAPALLRLLPLIEHHFLNDKELNEIERKIWGSHPSSDKLPVTGLFRYVLLEVPSKQPALVEKMLREYLFESKGDELFDLHILSEIASSAFLKVIQVYPTHEQSIDYFNRIVKWRIKEDSLFMDVMGGERQKGELLAKVMAHSIAPSLSKLELTEENYNKLFELYQNVEAHELLLAFVYFTSVNEYITECIERLLSKNLHSNEANSVANAAYAILKWRCKTEAKVDRLIARMIFIIGSNITTGLHALLWTANELLGKNYLSDENVESLKESLPAIFDSCDYHNVDPSSRESISISLIREACIRLAINIQKKEDKEHTELSRIIEEARLDPLPEVRFAGLNEWYG